jgi:hypothetical protein
VEEKRERGSKPRKKPYTKPEIMQVRLTPEEAVLGNCKASGSTTNSVSPGNICQVCGGVLGS